MQAESNAESSYRSFLHYFHPTLSDHLSLYKSVPLQRVTALERFYCIYKTIIILSPINRGQPTLHVKFEALISDHSDNHFVCKVSVTLTFDLKSRKCH
jgi:hypothetical protein